MPLSVQQAYEHISDHVQRDAGRFYGSADGLDTGAGLIFRGVAYPQFIEERQLFGTLRGLVYVVTHECDMSQENARHFNEDVAIIPIIPFKNFVDQFLNKVVEEKNKLGFLSNLVQRNIHRLTYISPFPSCDLGAVMFFNQITSTKMHLLEQDGAERVTALSEYGRQVIDILLQNHFFRPTQKMPLRYH